MNRSTRRALIQMAFAVFFLIPLNLDSALTAFGVRQGYWQVLGYTFTAFGLAVAMSYLAFACFNFDRSLREPADNARRGRP